jgi:hypothetical protein
MFLPFLLFLFKYNSRDAYIVARTALGKFGQKTLQCGAAFFKTLISEVVQNDAVKAGDLFAVAFQRKRAVYAVSTDKNRLRQFRGEKNAEEFRRVLFAERCGNIEPAGVIPGNGFGNTTVMFKVDAFAVANMLAEPETVYYGNGEQRTAIRGGYIFGIDTPIKSERVKIRRIILPIVKNTLFPGAVNRST